MITFTQPSIVRCKTIERVVIVIVIAAQSKSLFFLRWWRNGWQRNPQQDMTIKK
jgi:hypothetical protein